MTNFNTTREFAERAGARHECEAFEQRLTDALDGTLSGPDQQWFNLHAGACAACATMLADARRGAAWLEVLKQSRPEPSADLFARIMAQTAGVPAIGPGSSLNEAELLAAGSAAVPAVSGWDSVLPASPAAWPDYARAHLTPVRTPLDIPTHLLQFPVRQGRSLQRIEYSLEHSEYSLEHSEYSLERSEYSLERSEYSLERSEYSLERSGRSLFSRMLCEPRLAMTAAMAFFSIALTLNLTGVRLDELHARDLSPTTLRRTFFEVRAGAVRSYDGLHMVQVLESRVDDIRDANAADGTPEPASGTQATPGQPATPPAKVQRERTLQPRLHPDAMSISGNHLAPATPPVGMPPALLALARVPIAVDDMHPLFTGGL